MIVAKTAWVKRLNIGSKSFTECPKCGREISYRISGYEYPLGAYEYEDNEIYGGDFDEEPQMAVVVCEDEFDFDEAYQEYDRIHPLIMEIARDPEVIYKISSRQFEILIERLLQEEGFDTKLTPATKDGGRDIIATKYEMGKPIVFYIECKRYGRENSVGVNIVRSLYGVQTSDQVNKSILVTTGHVTRGAYRFVDEQKTMMSIMNVDEIHRLIRRSARRATRR